MFFVKLYYFYIFAKKYFLQITILMSESLILNTLSFNFPKEPITFYFCIEDRKNLRLTKLSHQLFPKEVKTHFPNIGNADTLYTTFTFKSESLPPHRDIF